MKQTLQRTGVVLLLISVLITVALLVSPLMFTGSYAYGKTKTALQNNAPTIESFRLINAETNEAIGTFDPLLDGAVLALDNLPTTALNIQANGDAANIGSVQFLLNGEVVRTENEAPFALAGDRNGNYQSWTPTIGSYALTVIPFSGANGSGTVGAALTIRFTVIATQSGTATPAATLMVTPSATPTATPAKMAVLVFSKTSGFRHASIAAGQAAIEALGVENKFAVTLSEDATLFTDSGLAAFQVVIFLNTTGDILDVTQQAAFERFIQGGGGFVGIHSATDTEYDWPWYGGLVVTHMSNHSPVVQASVAVVHDEHRVAAGLPTTWSRVDEWYNFQSNPSATDVELLITVDESSYSGGTMGNPHPIAWRHPYDGGRAWYTAMGHTPESFDEPYFRRHLLDGILWTAAQAGVPGNVAGTLVKWHPITISFQGPTATESDLNPNPFLDYRLQVTMVSPSGKMTVVPGFFAGDGGGNGSGNVWQVRFAPNEAGTWRYQASFRTGQAVAVDLASNAGEGTSFDGTEGQFTVAARDPNAPGFLAMGRLGYTADHYLKFEDGPYWIKGGTDSPENFLGYAGFDNTVDQGGRVSNFLHTYSTHRADWVNGDPSFAGANGDDGKGIIGALNYLATQRVNSIYFLPMNLGGDGQETYPFISPSNTNEAKTHYDISKLYQWNVVFAHAQRKGIALHIVLNETEQPNEAWLDNRALGVERKLFYRELIARYGYLLAIKWNLSEENDFPVASLQSFADYITALDWANHPIAVHTRPNNFADYEQIEGDSRFSATSIQYNPDRAGDYVETWRSRSRAAGRPWILDMDENNPAGEGLTDLNAADLRKRVLYDVYFSGGNLEWYAGYHGLPLGGDLRLEDFRTREEMWQYMGHARRFMEDNLPFWRMDPADDLLSGEMTTLGGGEVFAATGEIYAIYLPNAATGAATLDLTAVDTAEQFTSRWYNPRTGEFVGQGPGGTGGGTMTLGLPPSETAEDWVLLVQRSGGIFTPTPTLTPITGATPTSTPVLGATPTPTSTPITGATPTPTVTLSATVQQTPIAGSTVIFYLPLLLN